MPILSKKQTDRSRVNESSRSPRPPFPAPPDDPTRVHPLSSHPIPPRNELVFHCQLAHGSPTKDIQNFSNVKELYTRIGEAFEISPNSVNPLSTLIYLMFNFFLISLLLFSDYILYFKHSQNRHDTPPRRTNWSR